MLGLPNVMILEVMSRSSEACRTIRLFGWYCSSRASSPWGNWTRRNRRSAKLRRKAPLLLSRLVLTDQLEVVNQILDWGMETAPDEACGLLILQSTSTYLLMHLKNEAENPRRTYAMSPHSIGEVIEEQRVWEEQTTIWHTHPGGTVGPSPSDLDIMVKGCRYMVVTLPGGEVNYFGAEPILRS
jgi:proteasome lid subunit RPN8/RPN11